jgi:predicted DNA-binding ArsR family transcriptional regulator
MYTKEQVQREINKVKRGYENILIDIMFSLLDIEEEIQTNPFPIENIEEKIDKLKKEIGKNLKD